MIRLSSLSEARCAGRAGVDRAGVGVFASIAAVLLAAAQPALAAPGPTPSCQEWQTVTQVPVTPNGPKSKPVCQNAPPKPFPAPSWAPETVVGGPRLAATGIIVDLPAGVPAPPQVIDVSYVLADLDTGEILAAKSPHAWLRPASTLKTLTALTLIPRLDPKKVVIATDDQVGANGTRAGMITGNPYPVGKLFEALLMQSANDAAYGLADAAGGYDKTVALMNEAAREIGAYDTVTVDPSGLDEPGQHSSAYDLALIGRAAMGLKDFRSYVTKRDAVFPGGTEKTTGTKYDPFHIGNINPLLDHYRGAIGVKPGRTNRAQHTFIGAATRDGRTLIVSQMGSTTGSWEPTAALLDWGFAHADQVTPVGRLVDPGEAEPPSKPAAPTEAPTAAVQQTGTPAPAADPAAPTLGLAPGEVRVAALAAAGVSALGVLVLWARRRTHRGRHR